MKKLLLFFIVLLPLTLSAQNFERRHLNNGTWESKYFYLNTVIKKDTITVNYFQITKVQTYWGNLMFQDISDNVSRVGYTDRFRDIFAVKGDSIVFIKTERLKIDPDLKWDVQWSKPEITSGVDKARIRGL